MIETVDMLEGRLSPCVVLVFLRAPQLGGVKTRLAQWLEPSTVLELYQCFVKDILETVKKSAYPVQLCYTPQTAKSLIMDWLGWDLAFRYQRGEGLGRRMANAFDRVFRESFKRALLVGTDVPQLPGKFLHDAFNALDHYDAVIGPSMDGGYYLIGFRHETFKMDFFDDVDWGTDQVLRQTMALFSKRKFRIFTLPPLRDIDDMDDLRQIDFRNSPNAIHTMTFLVKCGLVRQTPTPKSSTLENKIGKIH